MRKQAFNQAFENNSMEASTSGRDSLTNLIISIVPVVSCIIDYQI